MPKKKAKIELPLAPLGDLMKWWRSQKVPGLIIGGLAVALLGRARVTRVIDAMVLLAEDRDLLDIDGLLAAHPDLDLGRVRH